MILYSIAVQADGKILAGGIFTSIGGQTRNRIARLDPMTGLADSFDPNANDLVYSIACRRTARFSRAGYFGLNSIGGQTRYRIARLDAHHRLGRSVQPERGLGRPFNRGADGRQDLGGRRVSQHRRTDAQLFRSFE